jgi:hypothetical protein
VRVIYSEQNDGVDPVPAWGEWRGPYSRSLPSPEWTQYVNRLNYDDAQLVRQPLFNNLDRAAGTVSHTLTVPLRAASDAAAPANTSMHTMGPVDDVAHALSVTLNAEHAEHAVDSGSVSVSYCGFEGAGCGCCMAVGVGHELTVGGDTWSWAHHTDGPARCLTPSMVQRSAAPLFIPGQHEYTTTQVVPITVTLTEALGTKGNLTALAQLLMLSTEFSVRLYLAWPRWEVACAGGWRACTRAAQLHVWHNLTVDSLSPDVTTRWEVSMPLPSMTYDELSLHLVLDEEGALPPTFKAAGTRWMVPFKLCWPSKLQLDDSGVAVMHDMHGHHNMPLATVAQATVWDGVLVLDESFLQTNLSDVEEQKRDDVTWFSFSFTEHNVGFSAAATNGSVVNGSTGWWNEVRWDGEVVAAHPSELGPLEANGRRTHAFTINLGQPDDVPHTLEVWLDVGDRTSSETGGTYMPQRRRRVTVTFGGFGADVAAPDGLLLLGREGRVRRLPWGRTMCVEEQDTVDTGDTSNLFPYLRLAWQVHNYGTQPARGYGARGGWTDAVQYDGRVLQHVFHSQPLIAGGNMTVTAGAAAGLRVGPVDLTTHTIHVTLDTFADLRWAPPSPFNRKYTAAVMWCTDAVKRQLGGCACAADITAAPMVVFGKREVAWGSTVCLSLDDMYHTDQNQRSGVVALKYTEQNVNLMGRHLEAGYRNALFWDHHPVTNFTTARPSLALGEVRAKWFGLARVRVRAARTAMPV